MEYRKTEKMNYPNQRSPLLYYSKATSMCHSSWDALKFPNFRDLYLKFGAVTRITTYHRRLTATSGLIHCNTENSQYLHVQVVIPVTARIYYK